MTVYGVFNEYKLIVLFKLEAVAQAFAEEMQRQNSYTTYRVESLEVN